MVQAMNYRGFTMLARSSHAVIVYDRSQQLMSNFSSLEAATIAIDRMLVDEGP